VHEGLSKAGIEAAVVIHDADHHTQDVLPLTNAQVKASIDAELDLEARWRTYVTPGTSRAALGSLITVRKAYRRFRLAPPWHRSTTATEQGARMLRRLVNIELAHLHLLQQARDTQATWALVVEDDATLTDPAAFSQALAAFIRERQSHAQPSYVNVSRSFSHDRLDLHDHLTAHGRWNFTTTAMMSDIPLTNTVCAVLYRGAFLEQLVPALKAIPVSPVLPIDWKLNAALLSLSETLVIGAGDCWFLDPAPIVQGSMHD